MRKSLNQLYRLVVPKFLRKIIRNKNLKASILKYYSDKQINDELKQVLEHIKTNRLSIFPYPFEKNYRKEDIKVFTDKEKGLKYVLLDGKRLYFKKRWSKERIRHSFNELRKEQDKESPHRYLSENFKIEEGEILADIGVAEGNFALGAVEKAKALYLFETDREWIKALNATFEPWKEKVHIVNKFVSDRITEKQTTIDSFFKERENITFLKIDVDGAEARLLKGCENILSDTSPVKIALCTYHRENDERDFTRLLEGKNFKVTPSDGYMLFLLDKQLRAPFFRRGLIRAVRSQC